MKQFFWSPCTFAKVIIEIKVPPFTGHSVGVLKNGTVNLQSDLIVVQLLELISCTFF